MQTYVITKKEEAPMLFCAMKLLSFIIYLLFICYIYIYLFSET